MSKIIDDVTWHANWISKALKSSGYDADFSPNSLREVDRFLDEQSRNGEAVRDGLLSKDLGRRIFALGSYVGEVLRHSLGAEWEGDDADPEGEVNVQLRLSDGSTCWPVQRVMKRFKNGEEDSIVVYGIGMGLDVGQQSIWHERKQSKPWWKFR